MYCQCMWGSGVVTWFSGARCEEMPMKLWPNPKVGLMSYIKRGGVFWLQRKADVCLSFPDVLESVRTS